MDLDTIGVKERSAPLPQVRPGDTVKVTLRVTEGDTERLQGFQGTVIRVKGGRARSSFTVRRTSFGIGVERTFFLASPRLEKVVVLRRAKVRRARLYYLRQRTGKAARLKEKRLPVPEREEAPAT